MNNNSRFFVMLASLGAAIGLGNIWIYPYYSYKLTGLFFIPFLIALLLLGFPLLVLEFSIGRYFDKNVVDLFAYVKKWFSSIGWFMIINAFIVMSYYAVVLAWHIIYFFVSAGLQWKKDARDYFLHNVLQASDSFRGFTQFSLPVFIALIIAWILIFFYIRNGFESLKRKFLVTLPILILLMFFFLAYSLTLDNALNGLNLFLKPSFRNLANASVWIHSFSLAVVSLGLSFGIFHSFGRKTDKGVIATSFVVVIFELLISIAVGLILFSIIGFLSIQQNTEIGNFVHAGIDYQFTTLARALPLFYKPTLLSLLFFVFLSLFFVLGAASLAYSLMHVLVHKFKTKHANSAIIVSGFGFLFGFLFITKPGFYVMDIVNHFVYYNILIALLLQTIAIGWFFDAQKIAEFINKVSSLKIGALWKFMVRYVIPLILLLLLFFQIKSDFLLDYNKYPIIFNLIFGIGIVILPLVISFLMPQRILDRK